MPQGPEILVILLVALIVFGPKRLPRLARQLGQWSNRLRAAARELRQGIEAEVEQTGVKQELTDIAHSLPTEENPEEAIQTEPFRWVGPQPTSGPSPQDAAADFRSLEQTSGGEPSSSTDPVAGTNTKQTQTNDPEQPKQTLSDQPSAPTSPEVSPEPGSPSGEYPNEYHARSTED